jgi:hypothetical protein
MSSDYGLVDMIGQRAADPALLGVMMRLFNGHPVPALRTARGWMPGRLTSRRIAVTAHLLGVTLVGSYPFRGVPEKSCACRGDEHACDGLGCTYLCLDVDDHEGQGDMQELLVAIVVELRRWGIEPLVCTSRSGTGAHVFTFFDGPVRTATAAAFGKAVVMHAGAQGRVDVIPSAKHNKGFGTAHALPLFPGAADVGGGLVLDNRLRALSGTDVLAALIQADRLRVSALAVEGLTADLLGIQRIRPTGVGGSPTGGSGPSGSGTARSSPDRPARARRPAKIVRAMKAHHPQFKRALDTPGDSWVGGRSARDAYLAGFLARQGLSPQQVAAALVDLPGTKASERGIDYAVDLARHEERSFAPTVPLAGTPRPERPRRGSPWVDRLAPPLDYAGEPNPWWSVRERLRGRTGRIDGIVLAYVIDRWFRGPLPRRTYYLGVRGLAASLELPQSTVAASLKRLEAGFPDVVAITQGVPHPSLRVATAFGVLGARTVDRIPFGRSSGQSDLTRICCGYVRDDGATEDDPAHACVADRHHGHREGHGVGAASPGDPIGAHAAPED